MGYLDPDGVAAPRGTVNPRLLNPRVRSILLPVRLHLYDVSSDRSYHKWNPDFGRSM